MKSSCICPPSLVAQTKEDFFHLPRGVLSRVICEAERERVKSKERSTHLTPPSKTRTVAFGERKRERERESERERERERKRFIQARLFELWRGFIPVIMEQHKEKEKKDYCQRHQITRIFSFFDCPQGTKTN